MSNRSKTPMRVSIVALMIICACQTTSDAALERNKEIVYRLTEEVFNKGDFAVIDELFSTDIVRHFLPDGSKTISLEEARMRIRNHRKAFPDWREEIKQIVAEKDLVAVHFTSTGTNTGSFLGNPPTGKRISINEMSIYRIADGKIAEQWLIPDLLSVNEQLGLTPQAK